MLSCPGSSASSKSALPILQLTEKLLDLENENMMRVAELEKQLLQREKELESIKVPSSLGRESLTRTGWQGLRILLFFPELYQVLKNPDLDSLLRHSD